MWSGGRREVAERGKKGKRVAQTQYNISVKYFYWKTDKREEIQRKQFTVLRNTIAMFPQEHKKVSGKRKRNDHGL